MVSVECALGAEFEYGDRGLIVIVADDPVARDAAERAAQAAGARIAAVTSFGEAVERIGRQARLTGVLVEAHGVDDAVLDDVLIGIDAASREQGAGIVACIAPAQIDLAWSRLAGPDRQILCDARMIDRVGAIATLPSQSSGLNDMTRDDAGERLRLLNAEVARIAETLATLSRTDEARAEERTGLRETPLRFGFDAGARRTPVSAADVRNLIRARRMRASHFQADLFADPAWDMLLDLFAAELEHRRVSVSSLCIAAAVPGTTALRWIGTMVDGGLFERHADQLDRRRAYVALSDRAKAGMQAYFDAVRQAGLTPA